MPHATIKILQIQEQFQEQCKWTIGSIWEHQATKRLYYITGFSMSEKTEEMLVHYKPFGFPVPYSWSRPVSEWEEELINQEGHKFKRFINKPIHFQNGIKGESEHNGPIHSRNLSTDPSASALELNMNVKTIYIPDHTASCPANERIVEPVVEYKLTKVLKTVGDVKPDECIDKNQTFDNIMKSQLMKGKLLEHLSKDVCKENEPCKKCTDLGKAEECKHQLWRDPIKTKIPYY